MVLILSKIRHKNYTLFYLFMYNGNILFRNLGTDLQSAQPSVVEVHRRGLCLAVGHKNKLYKEKISPSCARNHRHLEGDLHWNIPYSFDRIWVNSSQPRHSPEEVDFYGVSLSAQIQ